MALVFVIFIDILVSKAAREIWRAELRSRLEAAAAAAAAAALLLHCCCPCCCGRNRLEPAQVLPPSTIHRRREEPVKHRQIVGIAVDVPDGEFVKRRMRQSAWKSTFGKVSSCGYERDQTVWLKIQTSEY